MSALARPRFATTGITGCPRAVPAGHAVLRPTTMARYGIGVGSSLCRPASGHAVGRHGHAALLDLRSNGGIIGYKSTIASCSDGLSNTILIAEDAGRVERYQAGRQVRRPVCAAAPGATTAASIMSTVRARPASSAPGAAR